MPNGSRARVLEAGFGVAARSGVNPPTWSNPSPPSALHSGLTPREREVIQDWMARRYLQLHEKRVGRRCADLPMPASVKSPSQIERFANHIRSASRQSKA
jgi:hypothetical protein